MSATKTWYIRSQSSDDIKGPFPGGQLSQEVLLGRHNLDDEVSHDKEEWVAIRTVSELMPDIFTENRDEPGFKDRLAAARRWADERRGVEDVVDERRSNESYESAEIKRLHRLTSGAKKKTGTFATSTQLIIAIIIIITVVSLAFQFSPEDEKTLTDCTLPAAQGVDWKGCNLSGSQLIRVNLVAANLMSANMQTSNLYSANLSLANLQYAQLHLSNLKYTNFNRANLKGASLLGADLSGATLVQADLSYANFRDAIIDATDFTNARLDNAIWIDGRKCKANSIGSCN